MRQRAQVTREGAHEAQGKLMTVEDVIDKLKKESVEGIPIPSSQVRPASAVPPYIPTRLRSSPHPVESKGASRGRPESITRTLGGARQVTRFPPCALTRKGPGASPLPQRIGAPFGGAR